MSTHIDVLLARGLQAQPVDVAAGRRTVHLPASIVRTPIVANGRRQRSEGRGRVRFDREAIWLCQSHLRPEKI